MARFIFAQRSSGKKHYLAKGKVKKGDGMDVHHRDGNPRNNDPSNLKAVPKRLNRMVNKFEGGRLRGVGRAVQGVRPLRDT